MNEGNIIPKYLEVGNGILGLMKTERDTVYNIIHEMPQTLELHPLRVLLCMSKDSYSLFRWRSDFKWAVQKICPHFILYNPNERNSKNIYFENANKVMWIESSEVQVYNHLLQQTNFPNDYGKYSTMLQNNNEDALCYLFVEPPLDVEKERNADLLQFRYMVWRIEFRMINTTLESSKVGAVGYPFESQERKWNKQGSNVNNNRCYYVVPTLGSGRDTVGYYSSGSFAQGRDNLKREKGEKWFNEVEALQIISKNTEEIDQDDNDDDGKGEEGNCGPSGIVCGVDMKDGEKKSVKNTWKSESTSGVSIKEVFSHVIAMEVSQNTGVGKSKRNGTMGLFFFVDGRRQSVSFWNIPPRIQFYALQRSRGSGVELVSFGKRVLNAKEMKLRREEEKWGCVRGLVNDRSDDGEKPPYEWNCYS